MSHFEAWTTPIGQRNYLQFFDFKKLLDEVMAHPKIFDDVKVGSLRISSRKEEFPTFVSFLESYLNLEVVNYVKKNFGREPKDMTWSAWVHTCIHGQGLVPHYHMGDEYLTSILYLTESKADLVLRDPRANMVRSWPQDMLKTAFSDHHVHPRIGDFVVFPTYVDHYVMAAEPDFRVSIAIDWCFK